MVHKRGLVLLVDVDPLVHVSVLVEMGLLVQVGVWVKWKWFVNYTFNSISTSI